jgi:hypothetical protein
MPAPGSNYAHKTFAGNEDNISGFLEQFKNCIDNAQMLDQDKLSFIFHYLS